MDRQRAAGGLVMTVAQTHPPRRSHRPSKKAHILGIDDDPVVQIMLSDVLGRAGYDYQSARDAREAEEFVSANNFDLVLLDRRLPDSDGLLLIEKIRNRCGCPVIVLSAMDETRDKLLGLGLGAADYITKPFSPAELCSRVSRSLARRYPNVHLTEPVYLDDISLVPATRMLTVKGMRSVLPPAETKVLQMLLENAGLPLSRNVLTNAVSGRDWVHGDRTVDVLISRLRRRLKRGAAKIVTLHGTGYTLIVDENGTSG